MAYKPISDYGLIGDMHSAALVGKDGSIDWCCFPRFDSPSVFAAILDDRKGGRFQIAPLDPYQVTQSYLPNTNILETTFTTDTGQVSVTDFMPLGNGQHTDGCPHEIHRIVRCHRGEVRLFCLFEPRFNYARGRTRLEKSLGGVMASGNGEPLVLSTKIPLEVRRDLATGEFTLRGGDRTAFVVAYGRSKPFSLRSCHTKSKLESTKDLWEDRVEGFNYQGLWRDEVIRSFLVLHLLMYAPTGTIVAAPTTSLPEVIGGERNWDYRYCWLRDSAFTMGILYRFGHFNEAQSFMNWLLDRTKESIEVSKTRILYGISPDSNLRERTLSHLEGYRGSRPVRIGNKASGQLQLDIFGEVILSFNTYRRYGGYISNEMWSIVNDFAEVVVKNWKRLDRSIWEVRGKPRHFVYSKVMCWVALDSAIQIGEATGRNGNIQRWREVADTIKGDILTKGWSDRKQSFVQSYGSEAMDASNLILSWVNLLPPQDLRIQNTLKRTIEELSHGPFVYRYKVEEADDGLKGKEGTFTMLAFWVMGSLITIGQVEKAKGLFEEMLGYANHLGLFSEMIDPDTKEALGNFPQAFSHMGVIHTARNLTAALADASEVRGDGAEVAAS